MARSISLTPVLSAILACGPGQPGDGTATDTGSSTGTTASSAGTTDAPTSSTATTTASATTSTTQPGTTQPGTTGPDTTRGTTDPGATTTGTTDPGTTTQPDPSTSTTDSTDASSTGDPADVQYAAIYAPGGLDRIVVRKADFVADLCTSIVFNWPGNFDPDFMLPNMWGYQQAEIAQGTAQCLEFMGWLPDDVAADTASGTGTWQSPMPCPGTLDLDITLGFPQDLPWVPAQDLLQAKGLPLQGC